MLKSKPLIIIEDDPDDIEIIMEALKIVGSMPKVVVFSKGNDAYDYLANTTEAPGLILCDMRLGAEDAIDLRKRLTDNPHTHNMSIPFVFMTNAVTEKKVLQAFRLPIQGMFLKQTDFDSCVRQLRLIINYWTHSITPMGTAPEAGW